MFARAMKNKTSTTWNGALSYSTPDENGISDGRLSLFFKTVRGIQDEHLKEYLFKSSKEDLIDTFVLSFNTRDCRGGKGERVIGRRMFQYLYENHINEFAKIFNLIPDYGRWDDLLCFFPNATDAEDIEHKKVQKDIVTFFCNQLKKDKYLMLNGEPISICAKWAPSEGDSDDRKYKLVNTICTNMDITPKQYRTEYLTPLRAYLEIIETKICKNEWSEINFSKVPSCAMLKLKKAFQKHVPFNFREWKDGLKNGTTKVNAKVLFPHEIVKQLRINGQSDDVLDAQWKVIEDEVEKLGFLEDCVVVVDTSSSMESPNFLPLDIAVSMGLLISNTVKGPFHNNVITFNSEPEFVEIKDGKLESRFRQIRNIPWGGSTDIQKTFDMILEKGKEAGLKNEDMPKKLFIISDMQFNQVEGYGVEKTNFDEIEKKYKLSKYTRPEIVFWNVNGLPTDFPVTTDKNGTCLISGASPSILKSIIKTKELNSYSILRETLDDKRYQQIRDILS